MKQQFSVIAAALLTGFSAMAGAETRQSFENPIIAKPQPTTDPKQFDDPLFKETQPTTNPKQFDDPLFKDPQPTTNPKPR